MMTRERTIADTMYAKYQVDLPDGERGPWRIEHETIDPNDPALFMYNLRAAFSGHGSREVLPGTYTRLVHAQRGIVMSDTRAEIRDHLSVIYRLELATTKRVLIAGLGIGMTLRWALKQDHIERIDVVEIDPDVMALVSPHYQDPRVEWWTEDIKTISWPKYESWDVAWFDIWDTITPENLPEMALLNRRYARRATWKGCWCQAECRAQRGRRY